MSGPMPNVGSVWCRGGCARRIHLEAHPEGLCPDCEAEEYRKNAEGWRGR